MNVGIRAGVQPIGSGDPRYGYFGHGLEISERRRAVHIASELAALGLSVPFLFWASRQTSNPIARAGLQMLALATLAVDGVLLGAWLNDKAGDR